MPSSEARAAELHSGIGSPSSYKCTRDGKPVLHRTARKSDCYSTGASAQQNRCQNEYIRRLLRMFDFSGEETKLQMPPDDASLHIRCFTRHRDIACRNWAGQDGRPVQAMPSLAYLGAQRLYIAITDCHV